MLIAMQTRLHAVARHTARRVTETARRRLHCSTLSSVIPTSIASYAAAVATRPLVHLSARHSHSHHSAASRAKISLGGGTIAPGTHIVEINKPLHLVRQDACVRVEQRVNLSDCRCSPFRHTAAFCLPSLSTISIRYHSTKQLHPNQSYTSCHLCHTHH